MSQAERLQKLLSAAGIASRRASETLIEQGRVTINGRIATLGDRADLSVDAVKVDGKRIGAPTGPRTYVVLNKPSGYVSTRNDPEGRPTVVELLPQRLRQRLVPVGRLDFETEGLLLLTDDGALAQRVAHPRYGCGKTYEVKVKGRPEMAKIKRLREGIVLDGKRTAPAQIKARAKPSGPRDSVSNSWWTVVLHEGRTRQVREMFFRIGHPVARLRRVAIGPIKLTGLTRGRWRELTDDELMRLRKATDPEETTPKRPSSSASAPGRRSSPAGKSPSGRATPPRRKKKPAGGSSGRPGSRAGSTSRSPKGGRRGRS